VKAAKALAAKYRCVPGPSGQTFREWDFFFLVRKQNTHISEVPKLLSAPSNSLTTRKIFRIGLKKDKNRKQVLWKPPGHPIFWGIHFSSEQVVGISGAMDYVITPEGSQFSCEHGVAPLGF